MASSSACAATVSNAINSRVLVRGASSRHVRCWPWSHGLSSSSCSGFLGKSKISAQTTRVNDCQPHHRHRAIRAIASQNGRGASPGLSIDLRGKKAFIAGIADDQGYGWAIAKALAAAGAEILVGTWVPAMNIFETSFRRGKFDDSRVLPNGSLMEFAKVYPLDAVFDTLDDVPEDIKLNKRYMGYSKWTVKEVAESVKDDFGTIDILVHSLANGPEVTKPLLETSRHGYLAALSASSYSYVSLLKHFGPLMNPGKVKHDIALLLMNPGKVKHDYYNDTPVEMLKLPIKEVTWVHPSY